MTVSRRHLLTAAAGMIVAPGIVFSQDKTIRVGVLADMNGPLCGLLRPGRGRRGTPCRRGVWKRWNGED